MGTKSLLATIVLIVISAISGFLIGRLSPNIFPLKTGDGTQNQTTAAPKASNIFINQTANIQGKITTVNGSNLTVTNDKNISGQFMASPKIVIYKFTKGSTQSTASFDTKSIETNQPALLTLNLDNGQYLVTSISFLPPAPPPILSSQSATPTK